MKRYLIAAFWLFSSALTVMPSASQARLVAFGKNGHWVNTWVSMPQLTETNNMPPAPFTNTTNTVVLADSTLRQTIHLSVGGNQMRVRFSNAFSDVPLTINSAHVALPAGGSAGVSAIDPATDRALTFQGRASVTIPAGAQIVSDPLKYELPPLSTIAVTIYTLQGQASLKNTSHPGSRTTSYLLAGDHVTDADLPGATGVNHWYFLSGVEVWAQSTTAAVAIVGDSITDGRGSTTNGNDRWPDQLSTRLQANPMTTGVAILNQAAGGNRVLNDGLGPNAMARLDRDVLSQSGVRWMILFEGINDIGTAGATEDAQKKVAADLIAAYDQMIMRAHAQNIIVYGATITPFGGTTTYPDPDGYLEASRQTVNNWIRASGRFDGVIDFDLAVRDPVEPTRLSAGVDGGDHLHLNPAGYKVMADAVSAALFWHRWFPNVKWHFDDDGER